MLSQQFFSLVFKDVNSVSFGLHSFDKHPGVILNFLLLYVMFLFFSSFFKDFLFVFGFHYFHSDMSRCCLVLLYFGIYLPYQSLSYQICGSLSYFFEGREEFTDSLLFKCIFCSIFYLSSLWNYTYIRLYNVVQILSSIVFIIHSFFFFLSFSLDNFCCPLFNFLP